MRTYTRALLLLGSNNQAFGMLSPAAMTNFAAHTTPVRSAPVMVCALRASHPERSHVRQAAVMAAGKCTAGRSVNASVAVPKTSRRSPSLPAERQNVSPGEVTLVDCPTITRQSEIRLCQHRCCPGNMKSQK